MRLERYTALLEKIKEREVLIQGCSRSTERRRILVSEMAEHMLSHGARPVHILAAMKEELSPTAVRTYAATLQAIPEYAYFKEDREWSEFFNKRIVLAANKATKKQATPFTLQMATEVLREVANARERIIALFMFVTASRYGDLCYMETKLEEETHLDLTIVIVGMPGSKGDQDGSRGDRKAFFIPSEWWPTVKKEIIQRVKEKELDDEWRAKMKKGARKPPNTDPQRALSTYFLFKGIRGATDDTTLTAHSMRVGASHVLMDQFTLPQIATLTLHGQQERRNLGALTTYTASAFLKEDREKYQLAQSLYLLVRMGRICRSNAQMLSRERFLPVDFESQDTDLCLERPHH